MSRSSAASTPFAHRNLPRLLLQAREAVMAHTRPHLRAHGLTDQQWRVLRVLGERALGERALRDGSSSGGSVDVGTIAREAFIPGPSLTGVLTRMARDGLVRRAPDPQDARRSVIEATARGQKLVLTLSQAIEAHYRMLEATMGRQGLAQLYQLLDQVIAIDAPDDAPDEVPDDAPDHAPRNPTQKQTPKRAPKRATA